nr:hypothetical protein HK105_003856 [Polyrhizophydium stewartii]
MIREFACPGEVRFAALDSARGLVFNANDKELQVWDLRTSQPLPSRFFDGAITSVRLTEDRSSLICTAGKSVYVFGLDSSELVFSVATPFVTSSASIHPSRDRIVVASSADLWVRTYSIPTGREIEVCKGHHGPIHAVSYSPDGFMYATGSEDGTVRLWETFPGTAYGPWK